MIHSCPFCEHEGVRFGSSPGRHLLRGLLGTRRRFCPGCRRRWFSQRRGHLPNALRMALAGGLAATLGLAGSRYVNQDRFAGIPPSATGASRRVAAHDPTERGEASAALDRAAEGAAAAGPGAALAWEESAAARSRTSSRAAWDTEALRRRTAASGGYEASGSGNILQGLSQLLKQALSRSQEDKIDELLKMDKKTLWDQYGKYFSSKEQAKQVYEDYKRRRSSGKSAPSDP
ncbi:MAG: hypothetical protein HY551_04885 [Elusimicrobia bacterium]|nr:hypothetical protein [Elusimicrobiota bacterium]